MNNQELQQTVPIWEKYALTVEEAAQYTGIGMNKLRSMSDGEDCKFVFWVGTRRMFKRKRLEEYLEEQFSL